MTLAIAEPQPAVRVRDAEMTFGAVRALRGVSLDLLPGEVHSLVGANGAGKSTLAKTISGAIRPQAGSVEIRGHASQHGSIAEHRSLGVAALYQETTIVPGMSAAANALLGRWRTRWFLVDRAATRRAFLERCAELGIEIDPDVPGGTLSVAQQRMLEIIRALDARHEILLMDEPTASLGPEDREHFYRVVRDLVAGGVAVLYISHDLPEVLRLSDRISVMREGQLVETRPVAEWDETRLVQAMLGRQPRRAETAVRPQAPELALAVRDLALPGRLEGIGFDLHRGEILGIAGLVGAGRTEILRSLAGLESAATGRLTLADGVERDLPRNVRHALELGIAMTPEDRRRHGIVPWASGEANITMADLDGLSRRGLIRRDARAEAARTVAAEIGLPDEMLHRPASTLSGGNQQKLVVGRWVQRPPAVLLLDEPTIGVDIGAKAEMLGFVRTLSERGISTILVSAEWEELIDTCDRILVVARGHLVGELPRGEATEDRILRMVFAVMEEA